jgi:type IV pilus assembly protein PilC
MKFQYKSQTKDGSIKEGMIDAPDKFSAARQIRENGEIPIFAKVVNEKGLIFMLNNVTIGTGVNLRDKIIFTRNLSGMLQAGLPLNRALTVQIKQSTNKSLKKIFESLVETINKGGTLSDGLEKYPKVFSKLFVSMVRAGEESGTLSKTLAEIGSNLQKSYDLNKKVKSAMTYPAIIMFAIILIGVLMLIYVVPSLTQTFANIGAELPSSTKFIIWLSNTVKEHTLLFFTVFFGFVGGIVILAKIPRTQKYIDTIILYLPVIGKLVKEVNTARTTRTLSSLLASGVPMSRALNITKDVLQNVHFQKVVGDSVAAIEKGRPLSELFKANTKLYPVMVGEMMEVGEETGNLAAMLIDISSFYETEVDTKTKDLSTIIEPVLMLFIGGAVGFFAISMITPMYSILDNIK